MDRRDEMGIFGALGLPGKINKDSMECICYEEAESPHYLPEPGILEKMGGRLDAFLGKKMAELRESLLEKSTKDVNKRFISRISHNTENISYKESILRAITKKEIGHLVHLWFYAPKFQRYSILEFSLGGQHWMVPEGKKWKDRYFPKRFELRVDEENGKFSFHIRYVGDKVNSFAKVGALLQEKLRGPIDWDSRCEALDSFLAGRDAGCLEDYQGTIQGWIVSESLYKSAEENLGTWVSQYLYLEDIEHKVALKWITCPTCNGEGEHINPSIDAHGITQDEFEEDPYFEHEYHSGVYVVTCYECDGHKKVVDVDREKTSKEALRFVDDYRRNESYYRSERMAERRMGA